MHAPRRPAPIERIVLPFQRFLEAEASCGILLLVATAVALIWANSPWAETYDALWGTRLTIGVGATGLSKPLLLWVNDGLMAVFFFVVGLEIKRELLVGELATPRKAALPVAAAVGGMVVPALIYVALNAGTPAIRGWAIPMATDIAFALGVLTLLGDRVPAPLKVYLAALAIVDDIGAVVVIALFYTAQISSTALGVAGVCVAVLIVMNLLDVRHPLIYALLGLVLWVAVLKSGVHATIAGVVLAMTIPARVRLRADAFASTVRGMVDRFERTVAGGTTTPGEERQAAIHAIELACEHVESPLLRMEHALVPWVAYGIMPVFALANAGVALGDNLGAAILNPIGTGIIGGLVVGKLVGVSGFTWLAVRTGIGSLPANVSWRQLLGVASLAGIGFTMSLFIANLAFGAGDSLTIAKVGILSASVVSGLVGWSLLLTSGGRASTT